MKCIECGSTMTTTRENYRDKESGLPNVILRNIEVRRCRRCGEEEVVIPNMVELHRVIAAGVINKQARLTSPEIRFLRKHLGLTGVSMAELMGVTPETISRWENGKEVPGRTADRLLRMLVARLDNVSDYPVRQALAGADRPAMKAARLEARIERDRWQLKPAV